MSDDVTIPRETAQRMALFLRQMTEVAESGIVRQSDGTKVNVYGLDGWADLLDPPRSLRDEVAEEIGDHAPFHYGARFDAADAVLAVIRARVAALPEDAIGRIDHDVVTDLFGGAR